MHGTVRDGKPPNAHSLTNKECIGHVFCSASKYNPIHPRSDVRDLTICYKIKAITLKDACNKEPGIASLMVGESHDPHRHRQGQ